MRHRQKFVIDSVRKFKVKALQWGDNFSHLTYFNNNNQDYPNSPFSNILAIGYKEIVTFDSNDDFEALKKFSSQNNDWLIGYIGYDIKNQIEKLKSSNVDLTDFPEIYFYIPQHVILLEANSITIESFENPENVYNKILSYELDKTDNNFTSSLIVNELTNKETYIDNVNELRKHIIDGDIYEINYCMGFQGFPDQLNPLETYQNLIDNSPTPFSVYQKINKQHLMCASPERFLKKEENKLISQPIKGTIKRGRNQKEDEIQANLLLNSEKERAENMMIVDLVRNDLARSCKAGSVKVEEIFGIYSFEHLFQMISTVSGELREDVHFVDAIKNAFPMGSMTGAPKIKVMELIEKFENIKRGLFSGTVGYIKPNQDFDFNVVIRSLFYNEDSNKLSFQAGSAITYDSDPYQEYEECMLKVKAIKESLKIL